jgi:predicted Fe-S protein YdhL (DUF1289 family)
VPSPCISRCRLDLDRGSCAGCGRTADEIAAWSTADAATKRKILDRCAKRMTKPRQRR